jgi:exodeoxyribonuclease-3
MKIASWNVNSLRVRLPHVLDWLALHQPDVLALQETKMIDEQFPVTAFREAGYQVVCEGQPTYNGVAVISKEAMTDVSCAIPKLSQSPTEKRAMAVTVNDLRIINLYVPNGENIISEKYRYKLSWMESAAKYLATELANYPKVIVLGDFNVAPEERDVHDVALWAGHVLFSEPEREQLTNILSLGFQDAFRLFDNQSGHYTWWDYRQGAFFKNNGLRIDHIFISQPLVQHCVSCVIDKKPRGWKRPSDHVPIIAEFH